MYEASRNESASKRALGPSKAERSHSSQPKRTGNSCPAECPDAFDRDGTLYPSREDCSDRQGGSHRTDLWRSRRLLSELPTSASLARPSNSLTRILETSFPDWQTQTSQASRFGSITACDRSCASAAFRRRDHRRREGRSSSRRFLLASIRPCPAGRSAADADDP
jgi:hypothetical protein